MLRMLTLPGSLLRVLEVFRPCFTTPTFASFATLPAGMVARPTHRTVCGMLASAGVAGVWHHSRAHRFFAAARWHPDAVGLTVLRLVVGHLVPVGAPLMIAIDDTMFRRSGKRVYAAHWGCPPVPQSRPATNDLNSARERGSRQMSAVDLWRWLEARSWPGSPIDGRAPRPAGHVSGARVGLAPATTQIEYRRHSTAVMNHQ